MKYNCPFSHLYPGGRVFTGRQGAMLHSSRKKASLSGLEGSPAPTPLPSPPTAHSPTLIPPPTASSPTLCAPPTALSKGRALSASGYSGSQYLSSHIWTISLFCYPANIKYFLRLLSYSSLSSVPSL